MVSACRWNWCEQRGRWHRIQPLLWNKSTDWTIPATSSSILSLGHHWLDESGRVVNERDTFGTGRSVYFRLLDFDLECFSSSVSRHCCGTVALASRGFGTRITIFKFSVVVTEGRDSEKIQGETRSASGYDLHHWVSSLLLQQYNSTNYVCVAWEAYGLYIVNAYASHFNVLYTVLFFFFLSFSFLFV